MKDLIERQAAIAVADSTDYVGLSVEDVKKVTDEVVKGLKQLPSAPPEQPSREYVGQLRWERDLAIQQLKDLGYGLGEKPRTQPEIIRCKDCKHGSLNGQYGCKVYHYRLYETHDMKPDDFCSRAERRTDE